ncbi:MAG: alpha/beta hydrolase [Blautia sp.]|nr:alpha/beta hydrolase [Blautia sp.]
MSKNIFRKAVVFNAAMLGGMHAINLAISSGSVKGLLRSDKGSFFESRHGKLYYQVSGKGTSPILFLHNADSSGSAYEWFYLSKELSDRYRIYAIDLPGCGRSEKQPIQYTNYMIALMLNDFIRQVIGSPVHICGVGLSGSFAVTAASLDPSFYSRITMINPVSMKRLQSGLSEHAKALRFLLSLPVIGTTIYHLVMSRSATEYSLKEECFFNPFLVQQSTMDAFYEGSHTDYGKGRYFLASLNGGYLYWDISSAFSKLTIPVTILYGQEYKNASSIALEYARCNANVSIHAIQKTKLLPHLENPQAVAVFL